MKDIFSENKKLLENLKKNSIKSNSNYYKYDIMELLNNVIVDNITTFHICLFNINKTIPILSYFLINNNGILEFPKYNEKNMIISFQIVIL